MATAVISWNTWSVEYYETMAAAERTRLKIVEAQRVPTGVRLFAGIILWWPFRTVVHETEKLVTCLNRLEALPSSVLVEDDVKKLPASLRDLFRTMCEVIQMSEELDLHKTRMLGANISRLAELSQQISGFADRYEDSQMKVLSRVSNDESAHYKESFEAYGHCEPTPEQATDEDVKRELLHF
jgi:hypothetical protein